MLHPDRLNLRKLMEKINTETDFTGRIRFGEPLRDHTTFRVGGPADVWVQPAGPSVPAYAKVLLWHARSQGIPVFILGGGANLVVADRGIRGIVLDLCAWSGLSFSGTTVRILAGTDLDRAAALCAERGLGGLEFFAGMPGTLGGAVWMNARCYDHSISDVLSETDILDDRLELVSAPRRAEDFAYKKSPFQGMDCLILSARFKLSPRPAEDQRMDMARCRRDRLAKGHYRLPSAGSAFKNDYAYGQPMGRVIDQLGLRGLQIGGARVADWHGNIIVNTGGATASDIRDLTRVLAEKIMKSLGLRAECEILFAGDWD